MPLKLAGKTVIVTRPRAQSAELAAKLRRLGARVVLAPAIRIENPRSLVSLDNAIRHSRDYGAAVFTSANAVKAFFDRARRLRAKPELPRSLFAVGTATRDVLRELGGKKAATPKLQTAAGLARFMRARKGEKILFVKGESAREELPRLLRARGCRVEAATAYRTIPDRGGLHLLTPGLLSRADAAFFASPSAAKAFAAALGLARTRKFFEKALAIAIGPTTARELRRFGARAVTWGDKRNRSGS